MNVLLIIPENTGTIASVSYDLYIGLCKQANTTVYVACLGPYVNTGFQFENVFKLMNHGNTGALGKLYNRIHKLRKLKKEYKIELSISTLLGATYWNVLSGISDYKVGIFHTKLSQRKSAGYMTYLISYIVTRLLCKHLDKLIAVNKSAYMDLKGIFKTKDIELVYNIHNFSNISSKASLPLTDKREIELFKNNVILYVGGLYHNIKGTDRLIKAFAKIKSYAQNLKLVYIGEDTDHSLPLLLKTIQEFSLQEDVFFLGKKSNPYQYMKQSLMLVSPSRDEGLPGVLIEALSLGLKCVATNSSEGIWEIMQCDNDYNPHLSVIKQTLFGYITPNLINNETFTIDCLAEAIRKCLNTEFHIIENFNTNRFSAESIISHYLP